MSSLIPNSFSTYDLTDEEVIAGTILTLDQRRVIQNLLSVAAEEKIALEPDTTDYNKYLQQEANLRGAIDTYKYLLDLSDSAEEAIRAKAGMATQPEV